MQALAPLAANLAVASAMVALTVLTHFWGLVGLTRIVSGGHKRLKAHESAGRAALVMLLGVFGVFALHTVEIWFYAALYRGLGETATFEDLGDRTKVVTTSIFHTAEERDGFLASGMEGGMQEGYDKLEQVAQSLA